MDRTAQSLTPGQIKQLLLTVQQGVPVDDIPPERYLFHIGEGKRQLGDLIGAMLRANPTERELATLFRILAVKFSRHTAVELTNKGYQIFPIPCGLTLWAMRDQSKLGVRFQRRITSGYAYWWESRKFEILPTRSIQVAWRPEVLIGSTNLTLGMHSKMASDFNTVLPDGCKAVIGSAEEYAWVLSHYTYGVNGCPLQTLNLRCRNKYSRGTLRIAYDRDGCIFVGPMDEGDEGDPHYDDLVLSPLIAPWE